MCKLFSAFLCHIAYDFSAVTMTIMIKEEKCDLARRDQAMAFPQLQAGDGCLQVATVPEHSL